MYKFTIFLLALIAAVAAMPGPDFDFGYDSHEDHHYGYHGHYPDHHGGYERYGNGGHYGYESHGGYGHHGFGLGFGYY
ncbi:prismalin-14 [Bicyclus anynana]|uniref:Prismalin-14 n=1 Tax=Bicyclus anynana TaxID=110368 RepID=A0A6J1P9U1_BICAN|nr:prismalin-14 [Bicyclus anynana]